MICCLYGDYKILLAVTIIAVTNKVWFILIMNKIRRTPRDNTIYLVSDPGYLAPGANNKVEQLLVHPLLHQRNIVVIFKVNTCINSINSF